MLKTILATLAALTTATTAHAHPAHGGHLSFAEGKIHAHLSWSHGPDEKGGESKMRLEWHDGESHEIFEPGLPFEVVLWMPSMNHGSAPTQIRRVINREGQVEPGVYEVTNMYFLMPGDWEVRVSVKYPDGSTETRAWALVVGGGGGHHH